jgi:acyl-CoA synthetase (AMP-forming)/AMP-acid ligase II
VATDLAIFSEDFFQEILASAGAEGDFQENEFFEQVTTSLMEAGELDSADRCYYATQRGIRVDGYGGDPASADGVLTLVISEFHPDSSIVTLTKAEMEACFKRLRSFLEKSLDRKFREALEETLPGYGLAELISTRWSSTNKVRLILITNKVLSSRVDGAADSDLDGRPIAHSVWDLSRLHRFSDGGHGREEIEIDLLKDYAGGIPVLRAVSGLDDYEAYIAVIPGVQLAAIYDKWGARLLEQNVRVFLQAGGGVNKKIRDTLINQPEMFFAYNNGLTATAEGIQLEAGPHGTLITHLKNLQIVNGGQTTASIHAVSRKKEGDLSSVAVQMKLSIIAPEKIVELVPKISEFANTQNKVNAADFFANHPFHVRIEEFSRRVWAKSRGGGSKDSKWFYERARGQYKDARALLSDSGKKKFDIDFPNKAPNKQLITKTDLGKYLMIWEGEPQTVSKGAQKNFVKFAADVGKEWERNPDQFNERYYKHAIAKAIVFKSVDLLVQRNKSLEAQKANVVAYAIAKLAQVVVEMGYIVDFDRIWNEQAISKPLEDALWTCAQGVNEVLANPPAGSRNVTEWAKQDACWKRVQDLKLSMPAGLSKALIDADDAKAEGKGAEKDQKVLDGIAAQSRVCEIGGPLWREIKQWCIENDVPLSPVEADILDICADIPRKVPTGKQPGRALGVLKRAHDEGCPLAR